MTRALLQKEESKRTFISDARTRKCVVRADADAGQKIFEWRATIYYRVDPIAQCQPFLHCMPGDHRRPVLPECMNQRQILS